MSGKETFSCSPARSLIQGNLRLCAQSFAVRLFMSPSWSACWIIMTFLVPRCLYFFSSVWDPIALWNLEIIKLFLNHWTISSNSISHWINYVRKPNCSSEVLQLLKTTCCLNSGLATLAWTPSNLWHHTHSIIKPLVVLCLLACLLFFLKGVLYWKMQTKVVQMLFVSVQDFSPAICGCKCLF